MCIRDRLKQAYGDPRFLSGSFGNGPAVYAAFPGFSGKIGFISAISHQFCGSCNRVRLTEMCIRDSLSAQETLKRQVQKGIRYISYKDWELEVDADFYDLEQNVYLSLYDGAGEFLYGRIPYEFEEQPAFEVESLQTVDVYKRQVHAGESDSKVL